MKIKNIFFSSLGVTVPALIFVITTPLIINNFGIERFGYISLFWVLLSVSSILDLGASRALTNFVAKNLNKKEELETIWSIILLLIIFSFVLFCILYYLFKYILAISHHIPENLIDELEQACIYILLAIPTVIIYSALRGVFEGEANFKLSSFTKVLIGLLMVLPLAFVSKESATLLFAAQVALFARAVGLVVLFYNYLQKYKPKIVHFNFRAIEILKFGAQVSVSTISSSALVYSDRFIASLILSPKDFGIYSLCAELVMRFLFIPGAISNVSYQSFSNCVQPEKVKKVITKCVQLLTISMVPTCLILMLYGNDVLYIWASVSVPESLHYIFAILSLGLLFNSFGHVPYAYLQATGNVGFTAKLHFIELIVFLPLMYFMCLKFGVLGLLISWLTRVTFDFACLTIKALK